MDVRKLHFLYTQKYIYRDWTIYKVKENILVWQTRCDMIALENKIYEKWKMYKINKKFIK